MSIYQNLDALLRNDARSRDYFADLPTLSKENVKKRAEEIRSYMELMQIVELYGRHS